MGSGEGSWSIHGPFFAYDTEVFQGIVGTGKEGCASWSDPDVLYGYGQRKSKPAANT